MSIDDLTPGTTEEPTGTTAQAADGSGPAADGSADGETIEQLRNRLLEEERLRKELERKNAQLLAEKGNAERMRAEARGQASPSTPATGGSHDPFAERLAQTQALVSYYPENTFEGQSARTQLLALQNQQFLYWQSQADRATQRELLRLPDAKRAAVISALESGEAQTVAQAVANLENRESSETVQSLRAELEKVKRQLASNASLSDVGTGTREAAAASAKRKVPIAEWNRILEGGGPAADKLQSAYDSGGIELLY